MRLPDAGLALVYCMLLLTSSWCSDLWHTGRDAYTIEVATGALQVILC